MNTKRETIIGIMFAMGAAIAYGTNAVLVREGLNNGYSTPLVGAAISLLAGVLVLGPITLRRTDSNLKQKKRSIVFLILAGVGSGVGVMCNYFALNMAPVVVAFPIASTHPLFAILFTHLFLRRLERITPRLLVGAILVVLGIILIAIGREV